ncbi:DNA (cytosine-5-)-methyltransferase [Changpingibacter yushuensis]|uniref:DNA (cytosine-5-)-methyltransferase n=1 Tax=Changpingibacter yushuensis TaxID=2758440 RepID=UPI002483D158|nr:DNA (cytosine-5-)-methyltransferase [Changpingibacter yushuensis]
MPHSQDTFTFIDLFAGIGGIRRGFQDAGGTCVFTSEWNKYSVQTYVANFGQDAPIAGDITQVEAESIPDHDVLLAGFPCQPFSTAGVSTKNSLGRPTGFRDETQGTLFFEVARIIDAKRPMAFFLENVKNLVSHDHGRTFRIILRTLTEELGYHISYRVIDGGLFVPQHRERIYIVGFREETGFDVNSLVLPSERSVLASVLHPQDGSEGVEYPYTQGAQARVSDTYTLSDRLWAWLQNHAAKHRAAGNGFGFGLVGPEDVARTLSARYYKDGSEILVGQGGKNPRRLTPRECARLMGFEDSFVIPVSDTQAYRQFGNSVVVPAVRLIAQSMVPYLPRLDLVSRENVTW